MLIKKLILLSVLLIGISAYAEDIAVTMTPVKKISTADKHLKEGDSVLFKEISSGKIIIGEIKELSPNGFNGQEATIEIGNFKYKDSNKILNGTVSLKGNEHTRYQNLAEFGLVPVVDFIRGGEVVLLPNKSEITLFYSDFISSEDKPVKIKPAQKISTCFDEIEVGDNVKFVASKDVYKNKKLYIKKGTPVIGKVDYVSENGWAYDNAQIEFKNFKTKNVDGKLITISSPLTIDGFEILKFKGNRTAQFFNYCGVLFKGKEVEIIPEKDDIEFNIWLK